MLLSLCVIAFVISRHTLLKPRKNTLNGVIQNLWESCSLNDDALFNNVSKIFHLICTSCRMSNV